MLFAEHWAVITPPGRKLSSSEEQGNSASEFTGVSAKRKPAEQANTNCVCVGGGGVRAVRSKLSETIHLGTRLTRNSCLHT